MKQSETSNTRRSKIKVRVFRQSEGSWFCRAWKSERELLNAVSTLHSWVYCLWTMNSSSWSSWWAQRLNYHTSGSWLKGHASERNQCLRAVLGSSKQPFPNACTLVILVTPYMMPTLRSGGFTIFGLDLIMSVNATVENVLHVSGSKASLSEIVSSKEQMNGVTQILHTDVKLNDGCAVWYRPWDAVVFNSGNNTPLSGYFIRGPGSAKTSDASLSHLTVDLFIKCPQVVRTGVQRQPAQ